MTVDYTTFHIPIRRDRFGSLEHKAVVVPDTLLPAMARIIEAATRPVQLRNQFELTARHYHVSMGESVLEMLKLRVHDDLEHELRAKAKKQRFAVITDVSFVETPVDGAVLIVASALAMPLIDRIEL